jgi:hypothetical protein
MKNIIKAFAIIAFASTITGCATQEEITRQEQRVADCKASGGRLDWDQNRIKRCIYPSIEDTLPVAYNTVHPVGRVVRAR